MDNLKIGITARVLGPRVLRGAVGLASIALPIAMLGGCAPKVVDIVPTRAEVPPTLVFNATHAGSGRNDARLGTQREALPRTYEFANIATFDRQRIVNGRPYTDFDTITRSRESFSR